MEIAGRLRVLMAASEHGNRQIPHWYETTLSQGNIMLYRLTFVALSVMSMVGGPVQAQTGSAPLMGSNPVSASAAVPGKTPWQALEELSGVWGLSDPSSDAEKAFRIEMRAISKGSALVETFGNPRRNTTQTVYHHAGKDVMATHYCAQGNQPRLLLTPDSTSGALSFRFHDVTNLKNKEASHMVRIDFKVIDRNHLERRETYSQNGILEESTLRLTRLP